MLTADFISKIKAVQISSVIGRYIKLQKKGVNYSACCPFHNEKSASFSVNDQKEIYKCFGCGASGDAIKFVMEVDNKTFYEACKIIGELEGIPVEEEVKELTQSQKDVLSAADAQELVLNYTIPVYRKNLMDLPEDHPVRQWLNDRGVTTDLINEWDLGWAGEDWHFITPQLIAKNWYEPATKLGIIKRAKASDNNYDGYRSRITFPIKDRHGKYIGMGGRFISLIESDAKDTPKYINPSDCEIYNKSAVLYGLSNAAKCIKEVGYACVTEGYMDVVSPHSIGFNNVVATCGTAFTDQQLKLLKKYTNHVVMWRDNDKAGYNSFNQALPNLLRHGFQVSIMKYEGKDPDDFIQNIMVLNAQPGFKFPNFSDAVMYRSMELWEDATDLHQKAEAKRFILELLAAVSNEILRTNYLDSITKALKWKAPETKKQFASIFESVGTEEDSFEEESDAVKLPEWLTDEQRDSFLERGYVAVNRKNNGKPMVGYYSFTSGGKTEVTNFIINPLFHVYAGVESRFLVQIYNGYRYAVLDVPAKIIPSTEQFQSFAVSEGNFIIFGAKPQWLRIASDLLQTFPRCIELNTLGWQNFKFFAWVNKIYIPGEGLKDLNNWGIIEHKEENFLVPASCEAYRQLQRTGDDPYENDRYLTFKESPVSFSQWAKQMQLVYLQKGIVGIAYAILTMFRDLVFDIDNNCPHLYAFGEPSSGKSKFAESITAIFYYKRAAFNLNAGTDFAFFNYMQRYSNAPAHLNEFDIEVIKQEWFQAIKGIYDGEGRERGKGGSKNRTEVMRVKSTLVLTGQKLVTADDNSVVTRSLIEPFSTRDNITEQEKKNYDKLKDWEKEGMSSILVELLNIRNVFEEKYQPELMDQLSAWRKLKNDSVQINQRIMQNYAHLATCYKLASKHISLPQDEHDFTEYCYKQAVKWSAFIRSSDTLSEFWNTLAFLADQNMIQDGWDYKIEETLSLRIRVNRENEADHNFEKPTKVLYVRLNNIHKLFQQTYRSRTGKEAMNQENLLHYFSSRKYYLGSVKNKTFRRFQYITENVKNSGPINGSHIETNKKEQSQKSSCYAFLYEDLGIEIERQSDSEMHERPEGWVAPKLENEENLQLPFG